MEVEEDTSKQVQVRFVTKLKSPYKAPSNSIAISSNLTRYGLSKLLNNLIQSGNEDWKSEPFDFLIDGEFVRVSLEEFLVAKGISSERVVDIEYIKAVAPRKDDKPSLHDDWESRTEKEKYERGKREQKSWKRSRSSDRQRKSRRYSPEDRGWERKNEKEMNYKESRGKRPERETEKEKYESGKRESKRKYESRSPDRQRKSRRYSREDRGWERKNEEMNYKESRGKRERETEKEKYETGKREQKSSKRKYESRSPDRQRKSRRYSPEDRGWEGKNEKEMNYKESRGNRPERETKKEKCERGKREDEKEIEHYDRRGEEKSRGGDTIVRDMKYEERQTEGKTCTSDNETNELLVKIQSVQNTSRQEALRVIPNLFGAKIDSALQAMDLFPDINKWRVSVGMKPYSSDNI